MLAVQGRACGPCSAVAQTAWAEMGDAEPSQSPTEREWSARDFENWRGLQWYGRDLAWARRPRGPHIHAEGASHHDRKLLAALARATLQLGKSPSSVFCALGARAFGIRSRGGSVGVCSLCGRACARSGVVCLCASG